MARSNPTGRPVWFKIYTDMASAIMEAPNNVLGEVVRALFLLAEDETYTPTFKSIPARILFNQMRRGVDEAREDYRRIVENNRKASRARWDKAAAMDAPCMQDASGSMQPYAEPEPYPEQEQKPEPYPERKEEQETSFSSFPPCGQMEDEGLLPWQQKIRDWQMNNLREGLITVNDLIPFPADVSWPPECVRNSV